MGCGKQARNHADNDEWIKAVAHVNHCLAAYNNARFKTNRRRIQGRTAFQSDGRPNSFS